jgi:hypothetical protein
MLSGISPQRGKSLNRAEAALLLYNSFDIDITRGTGYGLNITYETKKGENMLSELLKIKKVRGVMTENDTTAFTSQSGLVKERIKVNGEIYRLTSTSKNGWELIGREVEVYYNNDAENGDKYVYFITETSNSDIQVIDGRDTDGFSDGELSYFTNGDRRTSVHIAPSVPVIYNGLAVKNYPDSVFDVKNGGVTIIKSGGDIRAVVIWSYLSYIIKGIDLYKGLTYVNDGGIIDLDTAQAENRYRIINDAGEEISLSNLTEGSVISVAANGISKLVYASNDSVSGEITGMSEDGEREYITLDDKEYELSYTFTQSSEKTRLKPGISVTLRLDKFGYAAWVDFEAAMAYKHGYFLASAMEKSLDGALKMKIFTQSGKWELMKAGERLEINGEDGNKAVYKGDGQFDKLKAYAGYLKYRLNSAGLVDSIELPFPNSNEKGRSRLIFEQTSAHSGRVIYRSNGNTFGGLVSIDTNTFILSVPSDVTKEDEFRLLSTTAFSNNNSYIYRAYNSNPDSPLAEALITNRDAVTDTFTDDNIAVVTKLVMGIDGDGEPVKKAYINQRGTEIVLIGREGLKDGSRELNGTWFDDAMAIDDSRGHKIAAGDVIMYKVASTLNYEVTRLLKLYDSQMENPSGNGELGFIPGMYDMYYINPAYVDRAAGNHRLYTIGAATGNILGRASPFNIGSTGAVSEYGAGYQYSIAQQRRIFYGSVVSVEDGYMRVTSQDLHKDEAYSPGGLPAVPADITYTDGNQYTGIYVENNFKLSTFNITSVEYLSGGGATVRTGTANDVKSYANMGKGCSKVMVLTYNGDPRQIIVFKDLR